ncbi:MAG: hypothetical protein JWN18_182 [Parcubacteria group bacterium]|nr:hypothetical protein [Parcubacteria group bacterium]
MCDFSLKAATVRSDPARPGDQLIIYPVTRHSHALVDPLNKLEAVCMQPGTTVIASLSKEVAHACGLPSVTTATFEQVRLHEPEAHHDGFRFADSERQFFLLQELGRLNKFGEGVALSVETVPTSAAAKQMQYQHKPQAQRTEAAIAKT